LAAYFLSGFGRREPKKGDSSNLVFTGRMGSIPFTSYSFFPENFTRWGIGFPFHFQEGRSVPKVGQHWHGWIGRKSLRIFSLPRLILSLQKGIFGETLTYFQHFSLTGLVTGFKFFQLLGCWNGSKTILKIKAKLCAFLQVVGLGFFFHIGTRLGQPKGGRTLSRTV